ncbi:MAG: hypothetical protein KF773_40010 [Deltaproteobacteria bacterium]|nr:hypothetical protein [Deltaproteobacteria bacterium]MCW5807994.1 hypothetical protein [Deltaproteobacteria bacterium]
MGTKIITKTDRQMEDRMIAVSHDPERADTLQKARAFKRTWLELAEALSAVNEKRLWEKWGFTDFDAYCRKELHLRGSTVAKLLGSYRFLESSAPKVIERARTDHFEAPIPSIATVEFVKKATEEGNGDAETLRSLHRIAFEEGAEAPVLQRKFGEIVFPQTERDKKEKLRGQIANVARRLSSLIAEDGAPLPKALAIRIEETIGELLESIEN